MFVLIVQAFQKILPLRNSAPTQNDPPFKFAQLVVMVAFLVLGFAAAIRFRPQPASAYSEARK